MRGDTGWTLAGDAEIRIDRDDHGVLHVRALSEPDLYRGLGHAHARDRGLQMLLQRTLAQGRACEQLRDDDAMLSLDRFFRRLDLAGGVVAEADRLSPEASRLAQAYCDGVNRALRRRLPWELRMLGVRFEPWTVGDSLLVARLAGYVALAQSQGEMERLLVEMVQAGVSRQHLDELFPGVLGGLDVALLERVRIGERLVPDALRWAAAAPRAMASNNWVISGSRTGSGRALLANDPHLECNRLPAVWAEIVLELGDRYCIAATMPGIPGPLIGRTPDLAWGATYTFMDATDSWIEDCRDGCHRRVEDGEERWIPFRRRTEIIRRRRRGDLALVFHENDHGVLGADPAQPGLLLATRWAGAASGAQSIEALFGLLHATSVREGMALLGRIETAWNWVLADRSGSIGYQMSGLFPRRRQGWDGVAPVPGWDPANDWRGFASPEELPRAVDPESGFFATANEDLNRHGVLRAITLPMGAWRAERIATLLAERSDWTVDAAAAMQLDVFSLQAERFLAILGPLLPETRNGALLRGWDLRYDADSVGAALFERFYRALLLDVLGRVCGPDVAAHVIGDTAIFADFYAHFDGVLLDERSAWFGEEGRDSAFRRVAADALAAPARRWGDEQRVTMRHLLLGGRLPAWCGFDHGPIELAGGRATIRQGQVYRTGGRETTFAPSLRFVTDFAEDAVYTALAGGPSDRRFSRWYTSGVSDWLAGRLKRLGLAGRR